MVTTSASRSTAAAQAAGILREVFGDMEYGLTFRLWDGSEIEVGHRVQPLKVAFASLEVFRYLLLHPTADEFAEAYCNGKLEFEGDLFDCMEVADCIDEIEVPLWDRLRLGFRVWRLSE